MVRCSVPWQGFHVLYDGKVKCCCWSKVVVGNVKEQSIKDIWNGEAFIQLRQKMLEDRLECICLDWCPHLQKPSTSPLLPGVSESYNENLRLLKEESNQVLLSSNPIDFRIFPTSRCNLHCVMCGQTRDIDDTFSEEFRKELAQFFPTTRSILAVGGEPLMSREFRRLVTSFDYENHPDCKFRMITNGTILDEEFIQLLPGRFDQIAISIDSVFPQQFERIRLGAEWVTVAGAIERVATLPERDYDVILLFTIMRSNYEGIPDFVQFALNHNAVPSLNPVLETWHGQQVPDDEKPRLLEILNQLDNQTVAHLDACKAFFRERDPS